MFSLPQVFHYPICLIRVEYSKSLFSGYVAFQARVLGALDLLGGLHGCGERSFSL